MSSLFSSLDGPTTAVLLGCLVVAIAFEFVNGFHDTANAVATVIYTNSLKPETAVVLSGICNFAGVFLGGLGVALSIMKLLPVDAFLADGGNAVPAILALLIGAIAWNLGTWYLGIPASSSHTLIGAIIGVGLASSVGSPGGFGSGVSWGKAIEIGISLFVSPIFGFVVAAAALWALRRVSRNPELYGQPKKDTPPPPALRTALIAACIGVSGAHGSNDGQKGVGLIMLILMALAPSAFALNPSAGDRELALTLRSTRSLIELVERRSPHGLQHDDAREALEKVADRLAVVRHVSDMDPNARRHAMVAIFHADRLLDAAFDRASLTRGEKSRLKSLRDHKHLRALTDYAPTWVLVAVAVALGLGTMVGWKRIVVTVGEKIGKSSLNYAQGASAQIVAAGTIALSSGLGLPVSTTHVLSSGVAGTMVAQGAGLQGKTVRNIALAWVMTLPASMSLSAVAYFLIRAFF